MIARSPIAALLLSMLLIACGGARSPDTVASTDGAEVDPHRNRATDSEPEPEPATDLPRPTLSTDTPADVAAPPDDAEVTASGLASRVLSRGSGARHPASTDRVTVHYAGWRAEDGALFDSSIARGEPATFPLDRVIAGWTEGVQLMFEGEQRRFWIPTELAYQGRPGRPEGMLVFDVELIAIE
jgi:peptidylprolyl isomerase